MGAVWRRGAGLSKGHEKLATAVRGGLAGGMNEPRNVVELLQTLVRIPSVNPHGEPGTTGIGEKRMAEWLAGFLKTCGAEVELREVLPDRPNVVARWPNPGKPCSNAIAGVDAPPIAPANAMVRV